MQVLRGRSPYAHNFDMHLWHMKRKDIKLQFWHRRDRYCRVGNDRFG